ncbi:HGG motif-containing thioesterase, possibly involved in aromatic compounds catabolism [Thermus sp. CCB_US3_UF1]|nr:HGG motif-containing thioesterase, possibly involved in aromatic compounds catabolism [Thermus sp. CCB_US3_UF1]
MHHPQVLEELGAYREGEGHLPLLGSKEFHPQKLAERLGL